MKDLIKDFLNQKKIAIAGSFRNETKYAYRILKQLKEKGYIIFPINPGISQVEGIKCYPSVLNITEKIDAINLVTPPDITTNVVKECKTANIMRVWMQPGAESKEAIDFCLNNNMKVIYDVCIMLESAKTHIKHE